MVSKPHFFDVGHASSSSKSMAQHRGHSDGFEPPRNSLELPMDAYQSFQIVHEAISYNHLFSGNEECYQHGSQLKYLIDKGRPFRTKKQCKRSCVVARLMGMDELPSDLKPMVHLNELNYGKGARNSNFISPSLQNSTIMESLKYSNDELHPYAIKQDFDQQSIIFEMDKPRPREHPQEELLQKFKKEFEAWQASKEWERLLSLELGNDLPNKRYVDIFPHEIQNKQELPRNGNADTKKNSIMKENLEPRYHVPSIRLHIGEQQEDFLNYEALLSKPGQNKTAKDSAFREKTESNSPAPKSHRGMNVPDSYRKIVIIKPCHGMDGDIGEFSSSPVMVEKQKNVYDFLKQVKERLITEIEGKPQLKTTAGWNDSEIFFSERFSDSMQISPKIVKQIRDAASRENKIILLRSNATTSYRNEIQPSGQSSTKYIRKDNTRKSLSKIMKNVIKAETDGRFPLLSRGKSTTSHSSKDVKVTSMQYFDKKSSKKTSYLKDKKVLSESKSFRHVQRHACGDEEESTRNLMSSCSAASASGTKFLKLLLEDKNALTAAHIHRKQEKPENSLMSGRKMKKEGFNIKSSVSSLRHNLILKGKFLGKWIQLMHESAEDGSLSTVKTTETTPTVVMDLGFAQDNSAEVTQSPTSVHRSSSDEICRPYYSSPISPLEKRFHENHPPLPPLEELNSDLIELNSLEGEIEGDLSEEATSQTKPVEGDLIEFNCDAKTYLRDILVASGLYERNYFHEILWVWDTPRKPISLLVFDEVEEMYRNNVMMDSTTLTQSNDHTYLSHRILFDLLNEAFLKAVQISKPCSTFKKWLIGPRVLPHGNELLETLWHQIHSCINPPEVSSCPVESTVARDLKTPWSGMLNEDIDTICVEIESLITEKLVDELVCNLSF